MTRNEAILEVRKLQEMRRNRPHAVTPYQKAHNRRVKDMLFRRSEALMEQFDMTMDEVRGEA